MKWNFRTVVTFVAIFVLVGSGIFMACGSPTAPSATPTKVSAVLTAANPLATQPVLVPPTATFFPTLPPTETAVPPTPTLAPTMTNTPAPIVEPGITISMACLITDTIQTAEPGTSIGFTEYASTPVNIVFSAGTSYSELVRLDLNGVNSYSPTAGQISLFTPEGTHEIPWEGNNSLDLLEDLYLQSGWTEGMFGFGGSCGTVDVFSAPSSNPSDDAAVLSFFVRVTK